MYKSKSKQFFHRQEQKIVNSKSIKCFYNYVNKKLKTRNTIPPLVKNNVVVTDVSQKANILNNHFSSCFSNRTDDIEQQNLPSTHIAHNMNEIEINSTAIIHAIKKLKPSVSRTPDAIPSLFIKKTCFNLVTPLRIIFVQSLSLGKIPKNWTKAIVVPIHKKGLRSNYENYRPISLTSVFCRILESILHNHICNYFINNSLFSPAQHGFIKDKSTLTQQLIVIDLISENANKNKQTDMIMLDFSKAFDKVSHFKIISILQAYQVDTKIVNWIRSLLVQRTQQTVVDSHYSDSIEVTSGVPQGSVLGPLLFNIYLNTLLVKLDKIDCLNSFAFADDLKLISSKPIVLQNALVIVDNWCNTFGLQLNANKSEHISFSQKSVFKFFIGTDPIQTVNVVKDLGILVNNNLRWKSHVSKLVGKATSLSYTIIRCFSCRNPAAYVKSYKSLVRPLLEYNTSIWNTTMVTEKRCLKKFNTYSRESSFKNSTHLTTATMID